MKLRRPKRPVRAFLVTPGQNDGKPVVILNFGRLGRAVLDADEVDRLIAALSNELRAARDMGET